MILALPAMLFANPGRDQAAEGYIRVAWWGNAVRDERTNAVIDLFTRSNPGVTVEAQIGTWGGGYWDQLAAQAAARNLPDVIQQDVSYIQSYAGNGHLADLTPFTARGRQIDLTNWPESGLGAGRLNNQLVGLLLGTNAWGMGVDRAVLQRAGVTINDETWTWADYERIAMQIFQSTGVQTFPAVTFTQVFEHVSLQFGVGRFTADQRALGISQNQRAFAAMRDYFEMINRLRTACALWDPEDAFIQGRAMAEEPLATGRTWNAGFWSNQFAGHSAAANRTLDFYMYPTVEGNRAPYGTYLRPSMYISMAESSTNKELAARFINFFSNDIEANRILMAERGVPIPTNVRADLHSRVPANDAIIFDYITRITPFASSGTTYPAATAEVEANMRNIVLSMIMGRVAVNTGVDQIVQQSGAILSR